MGAAASATWRPHPEFDGKLTRRLARRLVVDAQQMSLRAVARTHGVGWHLIMGHVGVWAGLIGDRRRSQRCRVLLVDETSMRRRHRYVTVIVNGEGGQVLDMLPGRSEASLSRFFRRPGRPLVSPACGSSFPTVRSHTGRPSTATWVTPRTCWTVST